MLQICKLYLNVQALDVDLVPFLLTLLDGQLDRTEQAGRSKALVVKALKSMSQSTLYGSQVSAILSKSAVWSNYSQQNHDLFISNTPQQAYLPGNELPIVKYSSA